MSDDLEFTPGPWVADTDHKGMDAIRVHSDTPPRLVACVGNNEWTDYARHIADARLIAAAPDLYYALEQILDDMGKDQFTCCPAAKEQGLAALAKARGEMVDV